MFASIIPGQEAKVGYGTNGNFYPLSTTEARERGRKGGKKSAEVRRKKKNMQQRYEVLLGLGLFNSDLIEEPENLAEYINSLATDADGNPLNMPINVCIEDAVLLAQAAKAVSGDTEAARFVRDTSGNKPVEKIEQNVVSEATVKDLDDLLGVEVDPFSFNIDDDIEDVEPC